MKKYRIKSFEFDSYTLVLLALTIVAFVLRVWNVDYLTLWVDEYVHVDRARFFPVSPLFTDDNNGILYTLFVIPLFKLFAVNEFWARFPSVVFGTLLVPMAYLFAKKYLNRHTALLTAALITCSTYLVFWSRIARNYAIFAFFFLLLLFVLGQALNVDNGFKETKNKVLNYLKIRSKYLWISLVLLVLSILSHQLTFLAIYGILFYYVLLFVTDLVRGRANFKSFEAVVSYFAVVFSAILFIPSIQAVFKSVFLLFLPENVANWVLPNLARLSELWATEPYKAFQIYLEVLKTDYHAIYWLGFIGLAVALFRYRKTGYYLISMFGVLFLLMSFVFREPSLPRYLIYIYPLFLMGIALSIQTVLSGLPKLKINIKPEYATLIAVALICCLPPARTSAQLVKTKAHGQVVSPAFSAFYFPDWKTSAQKIKPQLGKNDVVISTMPTYVDFYLGKSGYQFRQRVYNATAHQYDNLPVDTIHPNANSTPALAKLLNSTDKAWLLADYYFNNVMTDPETRDFVVRNMRFEYDMSNQYVSVFSWDKANPVTQPARLFEFIHAEKPGSYPYQFTVPQNQPNISLLLDVEGITHDNAMLVSINGNVFALPCQSGEIYRQTGDSKSRQWYSVQLPIQILRPDVNEIAFGLNTQHYPNDQYVVYNMGFQ
ncbi:MAG: glycosyltransferase family 39 protein [Candidatus Symbiothrix sp.]|jgi:uncharacterized membrane protein|nr:glycosyltransferase family 39 protein [Candidatus Symbiothrix sp.]